MQRSVPYAILMPTLLVFFFLLFLSVEIFNQPAAREKPLRIVSLAPSVTETLFALGAGEQIVGICSFCDFPHAVERIDRVGSYLTPNVEAIIAKTPDVIIGVPPNNPEALATLQRAGLRVIILQVDTIKQIETAIQTIAREADSIKQGEQLLTEMHQRMTAVQARLEGAPLRRVLMIVGQNPLIAVGTGIFLDELITQAHGVNIAATTGQPWPHLSLEFAIAHQPEVIIDGSMGSEEKDTGQHLGIWQNFLELPALRDKRLYRGFASVFLRPGPRLPEGFEELARSIHPERFQ